MSCEKDEVSCTGWHWGTYEFDNTTFRLRINNNSCLDIDAQSIIQATIPSKTDLAIELKNVNTLNNSDELVEIRFCLPNKLDPEDNEIQLEDLKQVRYGVWSNGTSYLLVSYFSTELATPMGLFLAQGS